MYFKINTKVREAVFYEYPDIDKLFLEYGAFFIFLIVLLEYLNLPGFPAGVIMPLSGIWASQGEISFPLVMVLTVAAGLTGSWALYWLGRAGGDKVLALFQEISETKGSSGE